MVTIKLPDINLHPTAAYIMLRLCGMMQGNVVKIKAKDFSEKLNISYETLKRHNKSLEEAGLVKRCRGMYFINPKYATKPGDNEEILKYRYDNSLY